MPSFTNHTAPWKLERQAAGDHSNSAMSPPPPVLSHRVTRSSTRKSLRGEEPVSPVASGALWAISRSHSGSKRPIVDVDAPSQVKAEERGSD